ncbi:MAG TPA: hypothetical protein VGO62_22475 [Myxococcota bacterium]|jgi:hypothetical protein
MRALSFVVVAVLAGCNNAKPFFSSDIGVQAVPIDPGAAAGTFALKTVNAEVVHLPAGLGDKQGGGVNYRLVTRTYDTANDVYEQVSVVCGGYNYEVAGVTTSVPAASYLELAPSPKETVAIDATGKYAGRGHLQLWGLQNLPDPYKTPLPTSKDEAAVAPWTDRIFDMDKDNNPGITLFVSGLITGQVYAFQRKTVDTDGVSLSPDHFVGLAHNTNEALTIGADNPLVDRQSEGSAEPNPDPKQSYFEEARLKDGATCDDVNSAEDDGILKTSRPF